MVAYSNPLRNLLPDNVVDFADVRRAKIDSIGNIVKNKMSSAASDTNQGNNKIFEEFINQTQRREELLKEATEEQKQIFADLEKSIQGLKDANHTDSQALRKSIDELAKKLAGTPDTKAKSNIKSVIPVPRATNPKVTPINKSAKSLSFAPPNPMFTGNFYNYLKNYNTAQASSVSPASYSLYEDASTVRSIESKPVELAKMLGEEFVDDDDSGPMGGILPLGGGNKTVTPKRTGTYKDKAGRWRNSKGEYVKKPGVIRRGLNKLSPRVLGNVGGAALLGAGGALSAYDEYSTTGNKSRAAAAGVGTVGGAVTGGYVGSAIGGGIGALFGGVGAVPGAAIGGFLGSAVGGYFGSDVGRSAYDIVTAPGLQNKAPVPSQLAPESKINQQLLEKQNQPAMQPPMVVPMPTASPQSPPLQIYGPKGEPRPTENAFIRTINKNSFYI